MADKLSNSSSYRRGLSKFTSHLVAIEEEFNDWELGENEVVDPKCRICVEKAQRPVLLSCGHIFCWSCIVYATTGNQICPRCQAPHNLGPEDMKKQIHDFRDGYQSWRKGHARGARGQVKDVAKQPLSLRELSQYELMSTASQSNSTVASPKSVIRMPEQKFATAAQNFVPLQGRTTQGRKTPFAPGPGLPKAVAAKFQVGKPPGRGQRADDGRSQLRKIDTTHQGEVDFAKLLPAPTPSLVVNPDQVVHMYCADARGAALRSAALPEPASQARLHSLAAAVKPAGVKPRRRTGALEGCTSGPHVANSLVPDELPCEAGRVVPAAQPFGKSDPANETGRVITPAVQPFSKAVQVSVEWGEQAQAEAAAHPFQVGGGAGAPYARKSQVLMRKHQRTETIAMPTSA